MTTLLDLARSIVGNLPSGPLRHVAGATGYACTATDTGVRLDDDGVVAQVRQCVDYGMTAVQYQPEHRGQFEAGALAAVKAEKIGIVPPFQHVLLADGEVMARRLDDIARMELGRDLAGLYCLDDPPWTTPTDLRPVQAAVRRQVRARLGAVPLIWGMAGSPDGSPARITGFDPQDLVFSYIHPLRDYDTRGCYLLDDLRRRAEWLDDHGCRGLLCVTCGVSGGSKAYCGAEYVARQIIDGWWPGCIGLCWWQVGAMLNDAGIREVVGDLR